MQGFKGNKTLLPLRPGRDPFYGKRPILLHALSNLPPGPQAVVVNYRSDEIKAATASRNLTYCHQPELNGTGGAILAAQAFVESQTTQNLIITMGDVPFIKPTTYRRLIAGLEQHHLVVLGFCPIDKKQYGVLEIRDGQVQKIVEWKYWKDFEPGQQKALTVCNSGIYAARRPDFIRYLKILATRPQTVVKERNGQMIEIEEYFITDIVEYMNEDGLRVGYALAEDENETMGVDDLAALNQAQSLYPTISKMDEGR